MAYTTVDDPYAHHQTKNYTGTAGSASHTWDGGTNMQPDWLWFKNRGANGWNVYDSTRGTNKQIYFQAGTAEGTWTGFLSSFDSDGWSNGSGDTATNSSGTSYMAFGFKANGSTRTTFSESGDNPAGGYQANTAGGFSIVDYVGTQDAGTVAHGLGAVPKMIIIKDRDAARSWIVYHYQMGSDPNDNIMALNTTAAFVDYGAGYWNDTDPTSTVFSLHDAHDTNYNDRNYIAYVFTDKQGYSKFGWYEGRGDNDGTFVYTGFKPQTVMTKEFDGTGDWLVATDKMVSAAGTLGNPTDRALQMNEASYEDQLFNIDILSNGFKIRNNNTNSNGAGDQYIYAAFAKEPFVNSNGVPATAQ